MRLGRCLVILLILLATFSTEKKAFAWGERGHDLVARIAARVLIARHAKDKSLTVPFIEKEQMLGHFANVPDIVWRNADKETIDLNSSTHYVDLDYYAAEPSFGSLFRPVAEIEKSMVELCATPPKGYTCPEDSHGKPTISMVGSATYRVRQLYDLMVQALERAKGANASKDGKALNAAVNQALLAGGIMAHFVGDLSNPEHGTSDYNGWNTSQGGLHNYFETEMVNAQPLLLDQEVYLAALNKKPFANVQKVLPEAQRAALSDDPFAVAIAEALDARAHLSALTALDRKVSLLKPSRNDKGMNLKAERRPAVDVAPKFHDLLVERLSAGADTLAHLWESAWKKAGSPDLSGYQSYDYPVAPAFIKPDYLTPGAS